MGNHLMPDGLYRLARLRLNEDFHRHGVRWGGYTLDGHECVRTIVGSAAGVSQNAKGRVFGRTREDVARVSSIKSRFEVPFTICLYQSDLGVVFVRVVWNTLINVPY
jgi:hypothetical protein